ncbi:2-C-methyl-D-erythritol 4-phosphate cytidylyltransferase [Butyrivibrio sp. MC2013]|uniref:2-C-methyl-D-erythritol 4-phosphate cytidylyltransferase n=1 Tax=Butyrivibrio sp. MC2013 TaxID=1280686 RepID=UPI000426DC18|nr:2-C-methyl-D-erythritol 4-phosphate cytidylyltransferase [Butyrivibrio sp. MC2013]
MKIGAVVLAAGSGSRMKSSVKKQYMEIGGKPLIYYTLKAFEKGPQEVTVLVTSPGDEEYCQKEIVEKYGLSSDIVICAGGAERYDSVYAGLMALPKDTDIVMIHDGARPFVNRQIMDRTVNAAAEYTAAVCGMPVKDTIKMADNEGFAASTPDRKKLWMVQTPQTFSYPLIKSLYEKLEQEKEVLIAHGLNITDDAMLVETFSDKKVKLVEGSYDNIKITTPEDIALAESLIDKYDMI